MDSSWKNSWHKLFFYQDLAPFLSYGPLKKYGWILVSKMSQKLLKLEPWNLRNRLVAMSNDLINFWINSEKYFLSYGPLSFWAFLHCTLFDALHKFCTVHVRVLKFHIWILHEKIADTYVFLIRIVPFSWVMAHWKNMDEILSAKYLKKYWS